MVRTPCTQILLCGILMIMKMVGAPFGGGQLSESYLSYGQVDTLIVYYEPETLNVDLGMRYLHIIMLQQIMGLMMKTQLIIMYLNRLK